MDRDMETGHREIERDMEKRVPYRMLLEAAIQGKNMEALLGLLQDDPAILDRVMRECSGKDNPLHVGAQHGNEEFVREILNKKRELTHELNSEGQSPLHLASARGHVEVVKEILSKDADACLTRELNSEGQSPLHLASARGHVEVVKEILSKDVGACLTRELNSKGQSPLHLASERGHVKVVREILSKDADHDACFIRDQDGMIPLHLAAINGRVEVLEELVKAEKITAFILTKSGEPILHLCAKNNKFKALKKLIELVKDERGFVNLRDRDDSNILHLLAAKDELEVINILAKIKGVDFNTKNADGLTPFDVSMESGSIVSGFRIQRLLTEAGVKGNASKSLFVRLFVRLFYKITMQGNYSSEFAEALLVVAILIATVAFQARLNPPGGVWQDSGCHNATVPNALKSSPTSPNALQCSLPNATLPNATMLHYHSAGQSIMSYMDSIKYNEFSTNNDSMLAYSLLAIQFLLIGHIFKFNCGNILAIPVIFTSFVSMYFTYHASVNFISFEKQELLGFLVFISSSMWLYVSLVGLLVVLAFVLFLRSQLMA